MKILEKLDNYINESPKAKRKFEAEIEVARKKDRNIAIKELNKLIKKVDKEHTNGNITIQVADYLKGEIDLWIQAVKWRQP